MSYSRGILCAKVLVKKPFQKRKKIVFEWQTTLPYNGSDTSWFSMQCAVRFLKPPPEHLLVLRNLRMEHRGLHDN